MQFSIDGKSLAKGLRTVGRVIPTRAARPILQNVLVSVNGGPVDLVGTDLEVGIRVGLDGTEGLTEGEALLSCARLAKIVRGLGKDRIDLAGTDDHKVEVRCNGSTFKLVGEDPADFPVVQPFPDARGFTVSGREFGEMVDRILPAVAQEETRYAIHGALLDIKDGAVRLIGTDGKRLAVSRAQTPYPDTPNLNINIPPRALKVLRQEIAKGDPTVQLVVDPEDTPRRLAFFKVGDVTIAALGIVGTFPSWEEVVPRSDKGSARVDTNALGDAIRQVGLLADEGSQAVSLEFGYGALTVSAKTSNVGEATATVPMNLYGDTAVIHFNPQYLQDAIKAVDGADIYIRWTDPRAAVLLDDGGSLFNSTTLARRP